MKMKTRLLSPALRKVAKDELGEDLEKIAADLIVLRAWVQELGQGQPSNQWLIGFLRGSKHNVEKAKSKLEKYYSLKVSIPEFYTNRDPMDPKIQALLEHGIYLPLRKCAREDSPRPAIIRAGPLYKHQHAVADLIKISFMIAEILLLEDDNFTVAGKDILVDMQETGFGLLSQWTPSIAMKSMTCVEKALPIRLKHIQLINSPRGIMAAVAILKMFLGSKMRKRIQVCGPNYEDIYENLPKSILPEEYGGTDGSVQELIGYWKNKVESYRDWFLHQERTS